MTGSLTERYEDRIAGVLSCYDRVVVTGTLPTVCYAAGMTKFLYAREPAVGRPAQQGAIARGRSGQPPLVVHSDRNGPADHQPHSQLALFL